MFPLPTHLIIAKITFEMKCFKCFAFETLKNNDEHV